MKKLGKILPVFFVILVFLLMAIASTSTDNSTGKDVDSGNSSGDIHTTAPAKSESLDSSETTKPAPSTEPTPKPITVEEQVLFEEGGIKIILKSLSDDSFFGPSLKVLVENNSSKDITVQTRNSVVNGVMVDTMFSCDVVAGKKANDSIILSETDLDMASITVLKDIEFTFHIFDTKSFDKIVNSDTVKISTTADSSFIQDYDDSGFVALDKNNVKVVVKKLNNTTSFWGADLFIYVENNSNNDITIQVRDVSLNGFMVDPIFSCEILSGKKAYDSITFMESDLKENDIKKFESLELAFHIFSTEGWKTIYDSDVIKVVFED
jgi:hypothetical protein